MVSEWKPIETAPKDGTRVLLAPYMMTAHWEFGDDNWQFHVVPMKADFTIHYDAEECAPMFYCVSHQTYGIEPTHWMPLPEAPKEPNT